MWVYSTPIIGEETPECIRQSEVINKVFKERERAKVKLSELSDLIDEIF